MKHFIKKISLMGAGKKPKSPNPGPPPDPPRLEPPIYGNYKTYPSYSSAEIVDLICDGPIEGLVNEGGEKLTDINILQGIYFDNTPISSVDNVGSSSVASNPFSDVTNTNAFFTPLTNFLGNVFSPTNKREIISQDALDVWRKKYKTQQIPGTHQSENIGTIASIVENYSNIRADGLHEKFNKIGKEVNKLQAQVNKLDDLEVINQQKYSDKSGSRGGVVAQRDAEQGVLNTLNAQLAALPKNKANKKARNAKEKEIDNSKGRLKQLNAQLAKLDKEISTLDIDGKQAQRNNVATQRNAEQTTLNRLNGELAAIPKKQKQNRKNKEKQIDASEKRIKNYNEQIKALTKQLEKLGNFNKIAKIEAQIEQKQEVQKSIKFDWQPYNGTQEIDSRYGTLDEMVSKSQLQKMTTSGSPWWRAVNSDLLQLHLRPNTAFAEGVNYNIRAWKIYLNNLLPSVPKFEQNYINKILGKINLIEQKKITESLSESGLPVPSNLNKTFRNYDLITQPLLILSIGVRSAPLSILKSGASTADKTVNDEDLEASFYIDKMAAYENNYIFTCVIPEVDSANSFTGKVYGFIAISFAGSNATIPQVSWNVDNVPGDELNSVLDITGSRKDLLSNLIFSRGAWAAQTKYDVQHIINVHKTTLSTGLSDILRSSFSLKFSRAFFQPSINKYNFNNVLCEFRNGEENQKPLAFFNNTHIDIDANYKLTGPFRSVGQVRKFAPNRLLLDRPVADHYRNYRAVAPQLPPADEEGGIPDLLLKSRSEGGLDLRRYQKRIGGVVTPQQTNFHNALDMFNEDSIPYTYYIENPDVGEIIVTIEIKQLTDIITNTLRLSIDDGGASATDDKATNDQPGTKIPAICHVMIETGKVMNKTFQANESREYKIIGIVESPVIIDLGNNENKFYEEKGAYISKGPFVANPTNLNDNNPSKKITLPLINSDEVSSGGKRYVKIYKVSAETNSIALKREVYVNKVTEIVPFNFSYPFSAVVGTKIDARNFTSIPNRSYDCRLKKIAIPENYYPLSDQLFKKDKRYYSSIQKYKDAKLNDKLVYKGDWNGKFKLGWTDNPAWILYDILTNDRYGLGQYLEDSSINIWEIYKIGRYCDAVDDDGLFIGVKDLRGGLEPRFSCNVMFNESTKIFDAINMIANLFRGNIFFSNSELHFSDDRPREPIALFTNSNVKDGFFNYTNNKKDESFNIVEVAYVDKLDNFKTKIEVVKDEDDIRYRGYAKTTINTFGVTSKSMARRIGQHAIWQTTRENQGVEFTSGPEALLCRPGDLIIVEDEMKSRTANYGRILDVDVANKTITLDGIVDTNAFGSNPKITIYTPTGYKTAAELSKSSDAIRQRIDKFRISNGNLGNTSNKVYQFSHYSTQYDSLDASKITGYQHAVYRHTGDKNNCWYYDLSFTGWIMSTSGPFSTINRQYISEITTGGIQNISSIHSFLDTSLTKRGTLQQASPTFVYSGTNWTGVLQGSPNYGGIHDDEIRTQNNRQITTYAVSGYSALYSDTEIRNGSIVYLDNNNFNLNLLNIVEQGSTYRFQVNNTEDQIYKVISIRENSPNEYSLVGSKYDSGKWLTIENDIYIENAQEQYNSLLFKVIDGYGQPTKTVLNITKNNLNFTLNGEWFPPNQEQNLVYSTILENPNIGYYNEQIIDSSNQGSGPYRVYYSGLNDQGLWTFKVQVISQNLLKYNSQFSMAKYFIGYENTNPGDLSKPVVENVVVI
jgi:hypothetical protein